MGWSKNRITFSRSQLVIDIKLIFHSVVHILCTIFVECTLNSVEPSSVDYDKVFVRVTNIHVVNDKLFHASDLDVDVVVMALVNLLLFLLFRLLL